MEVNRKNKMLLGLIVVALILSVRLFHIQILDRKYRESAENNSIIYETIYPTRGIIYDRNGQILVGNKVAYDILVTPREVHEFDTLVLADVLEVSPEFLKEKFAEYRQFRTKIGFRTLTLMKMVPPETYLRFSEVEYMFPGFRGQTHSIRDYPFNAGGNLLGYVSEVDGDYIRKHEEYKAGDYAGKTGLEAAREYELRGEKGYHVFIRDARNHIKGPYNEGELDREAVPGHNIVTTIDAHLQQYGQQLMQNKVGSVVAIEPSSGEILAMVSSPGIDVDQLASIGQHYSEIARNPYKPLLNRTVQAFYPPGSVFKLINGLIGLQEGVLEPGYTYPCHQGYYYTKSSKLGCHAHRSPLNLEDAIMMSCNAYFCYVLKNIFENDKYSSTKEGFDAWEKYVRSFGFGQKLGSDFPAELGGSIPTSSYYDKVYGKGRWRFQTVVSLSIGQGEITATPLQIANLSAIMANRGFYYIPHIVKDSEGVEIDPKYHSKQYTLVDTLEFRKVIHGMWKAVNGGPGSGGTASAAAVPGLDICGKTGTAQNPHGKDNSVFICFAPKDDPKIAIAAYVENAGWGGSWAAPIASLMVEKYLSGDISEPRKALEDRMMNTNLLPPLKK